MNTKYSFKDFTGVVLTGEPAEDFAGEIRGSNFEQPNRNTKVFPSGVTSSFTRCNLRNCQIPAGATVGSHGGVESNNDHVEMKNDGSPWKVSRTTGTPLEPQHKESYTKYGISIDPADIPAELVAKPTLLAEEEKGA